jgi:hypothetical protein
VCKNAFYSTDDTSIVLPPAIANLLQEYMDVFPSEIPPGLPPVRGIEHTIDLIPGASLPNRAAYRTNPEETKEIQCQVQDCNAPNFGVGFFFLFFTRQIRALPFPFSFSSR